MNKANCLRALVIFAIATTAIRATPVDPQIIVSGGGDATPVTQVFTFMSDPAGGGFFSFTNATNVSFLSLDFFVNLPQGSPINCSSSTFLVCESSSMTIPGTTMAKYDIGFDDPVAGGVVPGGTFSINLNDTGTSATGSGGWGPNNPFLAVANLPEPASWLLFASGAALFGGLRRFRSRNHFER